MSTHPPPVQPIAFAINAPVDAREIVALREAVGWGALEADYPAALAGYWATVAGRAAGGALVAWCAILSDGVRHAVLLDVIVHPRWQGRGVGRALVERAVAHVAAAGITIVHVDFTPENVGFYERCGFQIGLGGIRDLAAERSQV
jgi:GNAT superfamily N-acetyltransferase